jgi:hypothetical protein
MPLVFSETFLIKFSRQTFLESSFSVFRESEGSKAPHHVLRIARAADRTPYLVELRRRRGSRACQTELMAGAQFYKAYALRSERFALGAEHAGGHHV